MARSRKITTRALENSSALAILLGSIALIGAIGYGCSARRDSDEDARTLRIAVQSAPGRVDPRFGSDATSSQIGDLIFDGLLARDENMNLTSALAASWEMVSPTEYLFTLRADSKFHDGRTLSSADVAYTYNSILDPKNGSPFRAAYSSIARIETPSALKVLFILNEPDSALLGALTKGIVPARSDIHSFENHPIGTGPFEIERIDPGRAYHLRVARDSAWPDAADSRNIEKIEIKVTPDETVRILELESGRVDLIFNPSEPNLIARLSANQNLRVIDKEGTNYSYLGFNLADPILKNLLVREAIAHAIDRDSIIKYLLKDRAVKADFIFPPTSQYHALKIPTFEYNPPLARSKLDQAGYPDPDGAPMRFTLEYATSRDPMRRRIAQAIQNQLEQVGIGVEIKSYEWGTFYERIKRGQFQIYSLTWVGIVDPDILRYIFHSDSAPPAGANRSGYSNPELDRLLQAGKTTLGAERVALYQKAQTILARDLPYVSLWRMVNVAIARKKVVDVEPTVDDSFRALRRARLILDR